MRIFPRVLLAYSLIALLSLPSVVVAQEQEGEPVDLNSQKPELPLRDLRLFTLIFDQIRNAYVEPISDEQLLENAIKGMVQQLDPHSAYLNSRAFSSLQESTHGEFSGVGLEIGQENGFIKVITPIDESPAYQAGIEAGDLIIELDGTSIRGISISEAAKKMRGKRGTEVIFTIVRDGVDKPFDVTVVRDTIKLLSVRNRVIDDYYGYLRIGQFAANTGADFSESISRLYKKQPDLRGIIIDLRNNPGGVLQASVEVVDALVDDGTIVYTEGRIPNNNQRFEASMGDLTDGLPVVVLINGGSASASEIVAGALQDLKRAVIMGTQSFGKGSVQTVLPIDNERAIKLTTALYFTPNGRSIQAQGIRPDIVVERATITRIDQPEGIKESNLSGHLENANGKIKDDASDAEEVVRSNKIEDNQLFEAVNLLKGMAIFSRYGERG